MDKIYVKYNAMAGECDLNNFKTHPHCVYMLEHVNYTQGVLFLKKIKKDFGDIYNTHKKYILDTIKTNDSIGKPNVNDFEDIICSPSSLRYTLHCLLIFSHMVKHGLKEVDIVEIGGGYGGLCFFLHSLSKIYNIKIKSYTIFDLKEVCSLQEKYLEKLKIPVKTFQLDSDFKLEQNSFLVSNYAFSEFSDPIRNKYTEKVLNKYISHGFLCWNYRKIYNFINKPFTSVSEDPNTGCKNNNRYVFI